MPQFFGVSPDFSGNTHWVSSYLLKSGQVSNALENGEITLLFPNDIPFPVTLGLEHPSTFLLSPPRGQEGHLQWQQARENTARGVGKSPRIDPRCCRVLSQSSVETNYSVNVVLRRKVNQGTSCEWPDTHRSSRPTCEVGEMDLDALLLLPLTWGLFFLLLP